MGLSLAELDAQSVTLLPERATLHHGGSTVRITVINKSAVFDFSSGSSDVNIAASGDTLFIGF